MLEKILIVDDEPLICELMSKALDQHGFVTHNAINGKQMLTQLEENMPDLIILDFLLPDLNGHELCRRVREHSTVPILMITAHDSDMNIIKGFQLGIDDFVKKPFNPDEVILRVKAILKRAQSSPLKIEREENNSEYQFGPWTYTYDQHLLRHQNEESSIKLTEYEAKLMSIFCSNPDQTISREQLYKALESNSDSVSLQAINVYVYRLRSKIGKEFIQSIRYKGYRFTPISQPKAPKSS